MTGHPHPLNYRPFAARFALVFGVVAAVSATLLVGASYTPAHAGTVTTLLDETFDHPDLSKWSYGLYPAPLDQAPNLGNPQEIQAYLPSAISLGGGAGVITASHPATPAKVITGSTFFGLIPSYKSYPWISGAGNTRGKLQLTYGTVTVRAKLPVGSGWWPAIWLLPADGSWPPEIDIAEANGQTDRVTNNVHYILGKSAATNQQTAMLDPAQFHDYTVAWTASSITFLVDGQPVGDPITDPAAIPHKPMYLVVNLAVNGNNPPPDTATAQLVLDRITITQP